VAEHPVEVDDLGAGERLVTQVSVENLFRYRFSHVLSLTLSW
jgi:hypothetical protein